MMCLLGVSMMNNHIQGSKGPQNPHFGAWIGILSQICEKIQIAISLDLCITLTWNLPGSCGQQQRLRRWSRMVVKQFQDGGQPPFWKSIYRHISVNKNLAIANRSRVSCAHNTPRASIGLNITPWPWKLKSRIRVTEGHWKRNHWTDHTRLTISRVIWR